ncbi:hypothetical protein [Reichenbachiella sp. MALMAid0571]|uniref:hypothetical protein n=1 Tax=Reichenbachiella sp. MALMAid0571 TaxID=3143939 RepID=UPI0032DF5FAF
MSRKAVPKDIETYVLIDSKRTCPLCAGIDGDYKVKLGQIAHLDKDSGNSKSDNLAFLCHMHHSMYDSTTSQSKNYTIGEVKYYRNTLTKKLNVNPIRENIKPERLEPSRPNCLEFDGINDVLQIRDSDFNKLNEYSISGTFKLYDERYPGVLISLDSIRTRARFIIIYYSSEHPKYPSEIHLKYYHKKGNETLATMNFDKMQWTFFDLTVSEKKIKFVLGSQSLSVIHPYNDFRLDRIQVGGSIWLGGGIMPLSCFLSRLNIFNIEEDVLVTELLFDYGEEYYNNLPNTKGARILGSHFIKLPKPN